MRLPTASDLRRKPAGRRFARGLSASLAVLFATAQLAVFAHGVGERHAICAEHGELIDVPESVASAAAPLAPVDHALLDATGDASHAPAHQHCPYAPVAHQPRAAAQTTVQIATQAIAQDAPLAALVDLAAPHAVPLFRLAPKTSPPV